MVKIHRHFSGVQTKTRRSRDLGERTLAYLRWVLFVAIDLGEAPLRAQEMGAVGSGHEHAVPAQRQRANAAHGGLSLNSAGTLGRMRETVRGRVRKRSRSGPCSGRTAPLGTGASVVYRCPERPGTPSFALRFPDFSSHPKLR